MAVDQGLLFKVVIFGVECPIVIYDGATLDMGMPPARLQKATSNQELQAVEETPKHQKLQVADGTERYFNIAMDKNHHSSNGKTHYFDWTSFNSYFDISRG